MGCAANDPLWRYTKVAQHTGRPIVGRTVGMANNKTILILIPYHQVVGSDGSLWDMRRDCRRNSACWTWKGTTKRIKLKEL